MPRARAIRPVDQPFDVQMRPPEIHWGNLVKELKVEKMAVSATNVGILTNSTYGGRMGESFALMSGLKRSLVIGYDMIKMPGENGKQEYHRLNVPHGYQDSGLISKGTVKAVDMTPLKWYLISYLAYRRPNGQAFPRACLYTDFPKSMQASIKLIGDPRSGYCFLVPEIIFRGLDGITVIKDYWGTVISLQNDDILLEVSQ
jgi:hypothetical protein